MQWVSILNFQHSFGNVVQEVTYIKFELIYQLVLLCVRISKYLLQRARASIYAEITKYTDYA